MILMMFTVQSLLSLCGSLPPCLCLSVYSFRNNMWIMCACNNSSNSFHDHNKWIWTRTMKHNTHTKGNNKGKPQGWWGKKEYIDIKNKTVGTNARSSFFCKSNNRGGKPIRDGGIYEDCLVLNLNSDANPYAVHAFFKKSF